jgi:hypothetical protein
MKSIPVHSLACWSLLFASLSGCQGPAAPKLVPIQGQVKFKQRPLSGATICFVPDFAKGNRKGYQATGRTAADGSFKLETYPYGEGAMVGFYKVTCIVFGGVALPQKYRNPTRTPLAVEVREEGNNPLVFNLID